MGSTNDSGMSGAARAASTCCAALRVLVASLFVVFLFAGAVAAAADAEPETVTIPDGKLTLHALLWTPAGAGPFPAVLFTHGSGATPEPEKPAALGPVFAR